MTQHSPIKSPSTTVSRRQVMIGAAGLSFAVALAWPGGTAPRRWRARAPARR